MAIQWSDLFARSVIFWRLSKGQRVGDNLNFSEPNLAFQMLFDQREHKELLLVQLILISARPGQVLSLYFNPEKKGRFYFIDVKRRAENKK